MKKLKFIKNKIHYIKQIYDNGTIVIFPDPDFQNYIPPSPKPKPPNLSTVNKKLDFIIKHICHQNSFKL